MSTHTKLPVPKTNADNQVGDTEFRGASGNDPMGQMGNGFLNGLLGSLGDLPQAGAGKMNLCPQASDTGMSIANWASQADSTNDQRFENETTNGFGEWLRYGLFDDGYAKCNQFVAAAFSEGGGLDYPSVDGRPPVVSELANPDNFSDKLSYSTDPNAAAIGSMVLWYDEQAGVHHSAVITGYDELTGEPMVTYAGAGEESDDNTKTRKLSYVTGQFNDQVAKKDPTKTITPIYRSWIEDQAESPTQTCTPP